ncbi:laminin subunit alpha-3 [Sander vitreus]
MARTVKNSPQTTSKDLQRHLAADGVTVHRSTIQHTLHKEKLYGRVTRKKPFLHTCHKRSRLRCAFGYYGNPMVHGGSCKPCNCKDGLNICDSLTGECITSGNSSCGAHCHECDSSTVSLLVDLEKMDDALARLQQQLQNISNGPGLPSRLEANISETKSLVGSCSTAVRHLDPTVEQLEVDVDVGRDDLSQLTDKTLRTVSDLEKVLQNVNGRKLKAEDLLSEAEVLLTATQDLIKQRTGVKPGESVTVTENVKARMMEEARRFVQEMRARGCTAQRDRAGREQEDTHKLLDIIRNNMADPLETNQTGDSLMASDSFLSEVAELLTDAGDRVDRTQGINLKACTALQHLEEFENHAAQLDGAKWELFKKLNNIQIMALVDIVTKAEKHAEELNGVTAELHHTELLSELGTGVYNSILNAVEKAESAANQSREATDEALKDVKEGGLVNGAAGLKNNSTRLRTEANETQSDFKMQSGKVNTVKGRMNTQKEKGESLRMGIPTVSDNLKKIRRVKNLMTALPVLKDKITQVEALSGKMPPTANMTESIRRIKDVIEETRNFVNRLPVATTFNGKGHVELRPPRNPEDMKSFTAVDMLLNRHHNNPSKADFRRMRRQNKHKDSSVFVFYLGNKNASGDYIGMAIRSNVLICVYKLGGVVHEVETSQIKTTTNVNSSDFDRVVFHRVYQDAEVNITQNFTSQKPVSLTPKRNLPNTTTGIHKLDPDSLVFYVGGYPEDFTPPVELHYPKYKGAMKLSYINDNPVCLFNYKHAVNMDAKQPIVKIPQSEVSDYYEGTGYRMAFIKEPDKRKRRLFKFHTNSRETNALLFYIGNEESFFCVFVERGFLVLQGQQAGRELRVQSAEKVSLFDKHFAITIADRFIVHYGPQQVSTDHNRTNFMSYYIGGLPSQLRQRHDITAPPLRGCVDHLTADAEIVKYNRTIGVSDGCPVSLLGVRSATLYSALSVDSPSVWSEHPVRVSLGFRSIDGHGALLRSSSQVSISVHDLQLSLVDGYVVFNSDNYTLRLELSIDNVKVIQGQSPHSRPVDEHLQGGKFKGCIANLYIRRPEQSFIPADLSSFSQTVDVVLGLCSLHPPPHTELLPAPVLKKPKKHKPIQAPAGIQCKPRRTHRGEWQLSGEHSWLSYTLPQQDLNHRPHFSLDVKTKTSKGLILHVAGRGVIPVLALYMANGKIKMSLGQNRIIQHKQKSNDGNWHRVEFSVEKSTFHLLVDGFRVTDGHLPNNEGSSLDLHNPAYLGGDPKSKTTKGHNIPMNSVIGCIREFKMNEVVMVDLEASHKTLPCFDGLAEIGTYFGGGHIVLENYFTIGSEFVLAFELRPQYLTGLLFHVQSHKASLNVFLMENKVGVRKNDGNRAVSVSVTPHESLCDGKFHQVTVSKQRDVIKLVVDSISQQKAVPFTSTSTTLDTLYIGGTRKQNRAPVPLPFVGCLRNVKLNGRPVAFETGSRVVDPVSINSCPAD